jgi:hypothetical protein
MKSELLIIPAGKESQTLEEAKMGRVDYSKRHPSKFSNEKRVVETQVQLQEGEWSEIEEAMYDGHSSLNLGC